MNAHQPSSSSPTASTPAVKFDALLARVLDSNAFYRRKYDAAGIALDSRPNLTNLAHLPYTTKEELAKDQAEHPPFGSNLTHSVDRYSRMHQTSGTTGIPLRWLDTPESWEWWLSCWRRIYVAAGVTRQDRIFVAFSFGPFIGFWTAFVAGQSLGAMMLAGGGLTSVQRLETLLANAATVLVCTPTYALRLAQVASNAGLDITGSSVRLTIHAGEPGASIPSVRARLESAWGARCIDHAGATEVGAWGHGCSEPNHLHVIEDEFIPEVIDSNTQLPVSTSEGVQAGELVLTNLGRIGSPVIRYRTGDLVELVRAPCPCGLDTVFLKGGVLGRADNMIIVRGVNVYPSVLEDLVRGFDEVGEFEVELQAQREMSEIVIRIETGSIGGESIAQRLSDSIHQRLNVRARVDPVAPGTLPRHEMKARRYVVRSRG